jgi:uroporphyrinogen-III synthase
MPGRVLVTRPEPGAARTAQILEAMGFAPTVLPLTQTVAVPVDGGLVSNSAAAVAVTSANAIRHAPAGLVAALAGLPCHAVGKRTAQAAGAAGFLSVHEGPGNAEQLADALVDDLAGTTIIYLCGRVRLPMFEQRLKAGGIDARAVETYDTIALDYSDMEIVERLSGQPVDAMLLYSVKAAVMAQILTRQPALRDLFGKTCFFALSERIAAALEAVSREKIRVAPEPNEKALLALLRNAT